MVFYDNQREPKVFK